MALQTPPCTWLIQSTVRGDTLARLQSACVENGNPFHRVRVVPFSQEMPTDLPLVDAPFIFYGYTTLLLNAFHSTHWRKGVFFDPNVFRPSVYLANWGKARMLNHDAEVLTMQQFATHDYAPSTSWFIKPNDDLKRFTGCLMTHGDFRNWYTSVENLDGEGDIGPDTAILICSPKIIGHEWRLFFVEGKIVAKSCYTNDGHDLSLPPELERFALDAAALWSPAAAFALDVTVDENGEPRFIEANCINGSGLYFADTYALVRALSAWQEAHW